MRLIALATLLSTMFMAPALAADHPPLIKLGAGVTDVFNSDNAAVFKVDLRSNYQWLGYVDPFLALSADDEGGIYGGVGLTGDVDLSDRWTLSPSFAVGLYKEGDSKDLGGPLEFRSGVELAYKLPNDSRIGMELSHMSNASLYDENPGSEQLTLNYHLPLTLLSK